METKIKNSNKKIITEKGIEIASTECTFDNLEEKPGISYEIIGTPGSKKDSK